MASEPSEPPRRPRPATGRQDRHTPAPSELEAAPDPAPSAPDRLAPWQHTPSRRSAIAMPLLAMAVACIIVAVALLVVALTAKG